MRVLLAFAVLVCAHAPATAQATSRPAPWPAVTNGQVVERALAGGLAQTIAQVASRESGVVWVGYAVPIVAGDHHMCDWKDGGAPVRLEPSDTLAVMVRLEAGQVERIRALSDNCRIDVGGRTVQWLTGVRPVESVAWLGARATAAGTARRLADGALSALALHAEPAALDWLLSTARTASTTHVRGQALFWLSQRAGQRAIGAIAEAIERDPDTEVKRKAVFALSQLPADDGVPRLIQIARAHSNAAVRKQAFFWLGQSKDPRALAFFVDVLGR